MTINHIKQPYSDNKYFKKKSISFDQLNKKLKDSNFISLHFQDYTFKIK